MVSTPEALEQVVPLPRVLSRRRSLRLAAGLAAVVACAVYANALRNGFVYDDLVVIGQGESARHPLDLGRILLTPSWFADGSPTLLYRPLATWTLALNDAVHGLRPFGYHLVSVLLHAGVSALVVLLAAELGLSLVAAGLAGTLFAVHPVNTQAVASILGRPELLAAAACLLALLLESRAARGDRPLVSSVGVAVAYALALLSREQGAALLLLIPLVDLTRADGGSLGLFAARLRGRRGILYLALAAITVGYLLLQRAALGAPGHVPFWLNPAASAPGVLRILTALKVQALAVWLLCFPFALSADYTFRELSVVAVGSEPGALIGLAVAGGLLVLAAVLWWRSPVAFFWLALVLLTYGAVSNLRSEAVIIFSEQQLYLPSVGFCALVAMACTRPAGARTRGALLALVGVVAVIWSVRTVGRNPVWQSDLALGEVSVVDAPESARAHRMLGVVYMGLGRPDDALRQFEHALRVDPEDVSSLYNAGVVYQTRNQPLQALTVFARVRDIDPGNYPALVNHAAVNNSMGLFLAGLTFADRAVALRPEVPNGHIVRAFALRGLGRREEARGAFEEALRLAPRNPEALVGLGATASELGDFAGAAAAFERMIEVAPSADAYRGLVHSYREAGRTDDADRVAADARQRFPQDPYFAPPGGES